MSTHTYTPRLQFQCNESWETMPESDTGRHCLRCKHQVHDFTNLSHEQILDILRKAGNARVCGRYKASQLSPPFEPSTNSIHLTKAAALLSGLLFTHVPLSAQSSAKHQSTQSIHPKTIETVSGQTLLIYGKVFNRYTKQAIRAQITVFAHPNGTEALLQTQCDSSGHYRIKLNNIKGMNFVRVLFTAANAEERSVIADTRAKTKYLPVSLIEDVVVSAPPVPTTEREEFLLKCKEEVIYMGVSYPYFESEDKLVMSRKFLGKLRLKIRSWFKRKKHY